MPKIFCTLTASHLLNECCRDNGLKGLTKQLLKRDVTIYEDAIKFGVHSPEFAKYATEDAINTYDLYRRFSPNLAKQGLGHLFWDIEMPFQKALMELKINGIGADLVEAKAMTRRCQHLYWEIEDELLKFFGGDYVVSIQKKTGDYVCSPSINFNSSVQVVPLVEDLGFAITEKSKKGKKSWGKTTKARLKGKHPMIDKLIRLGKVEKLLNGFLTPFPQFVDADGRVRSSFHNAVCVTGRLSCSKPNIEQLPKNNNIANIRNLFKADKGNALIVADYAGQELRIMAEDSGDKVMLGELRKGFDIHLSTANNIHKLDLSDEQLTAGSAGFSECKKKYKKLRDDCKCIGFGIPFGKSKYGFAKDFNCSEDEAQEIVDKFFTKYPSIKRAIEKTHEQVYKRGYVKNMSGRKRRFPEFKKGSYWEKQRCYRQSYNFKIQSTGADVIKAAAALIITNLNVRLVNIVHDEIVVECKIGYVSEGMRWVEECMVAVLPLSVAWEVELAHGERYGNCKG